MFSFAVVNPDNSYEVLIDNTVVNEGTLLDDFRYKLSLLLQCW